jgi:hypothetical protein
MSDDMEYLVGPEECPKCGEPWSIYTDIELFDGFGDRELRACRDGERLFIHSEGDLEGYDEE